jgi:large subunit ribosomal protein L6
MSRIGKSPIPVPGGVKAVAQDRTVKVEGPKGILAIDIRPEVDVVIDEKEIRVEPNGKGSKKQSRAFHGMTRALINNMVVGVTEGFSKTLEIVGVGWTAKAEGKKLTLNIGFCHPVIFEAPEGIQVETPRPAQIVISGADKQAVGQLAASVRAVRPPEPYKGKGIRYQGEYVRRKAGKTFGN